VYELRPRPDVLVIDASAAEDDDRTFYTPEEVHLVVEVVDPATKTYALTGIHHGKLSVPVPFEISIDLDALPR
jgi:hypothetical protein